jgi:hypothetical protein
VVPDPRPTQPAPRHRRRRLRPHVSGSAGGIGSEGCWCAVDAATLAGAG